MSYRDASDPSPRDTNTSPFVILPGAGRPGGPQSSSRASGGRPSQRSAAQDFYQELNGLGPPNKRSTPSSAFHDEGRPNKRLHTGKGIGNTTKNVLSSASGFDKTPLRHSQFHNTQGNPNSKSSLIDVDGGTSDDPLDFLNTQLRPDGPITAQLKSQRRRDPFPTPEGITPGIVQQRKQEFSRVAAFTDLRKEVSVSSNMKPRDAQSNPQQLTGNASRLATNLGKKSNQTGTLPITFWANGDKLYPNRSDEWYLTYHNQRNKERLVISNRNNRRDEMHVELDRQWDTVEMASPQSLAWFVFFSNSSPPVSGGTVRTGTKSSIKPDDRAFFIIDVTESHRQEYCQLCTLLERKISIHESTRVISGEILKRWMEKHFRGKPPPAAIEVANFFSTNGQYEVLEATDDTSFNAILSDRTIDDIPAAPGRMKKRNIDSTGRQIPLTSRHFSPPKHKTRPRVSKEKQPYNETATVSELQFEDDIPVAESSSMALRRRSRHQVSENLEELILVYPFDGKGAVNITRGDYNRLGPFEFLNDTLIEFGIKHWMNRLREQDPVTADQIHVFSSFFYKKLNTRNSEEGYQSVKKWTSKVDLFDKKYIIIPINEHLHWYLAIILNPAYALELPPLPPQFTDGPSARTRKKRTSLGTDAANEDMDISVDLPQDPLAGDKSDGTLDATSPLTEPEDDDDEPTELAIGTDDEALAQASRRPPGRDEANKSTESLGDFGEAFLLNSEPIEPPEIFAKLPESQDADNAKSEQAPPLLPAPLSAHIDVDQDEDASTVVGDPSVVVSLSTGPASAVGFYSNEKAKPRTSDEDGRRIEKGTSLLSIKDKDEDKHIDVTDDVELASASVDGSHLRKPEEVEAELTRKVPRIFVMDSLGGAHKQTINKLSFYLEREAEVKRNKTKDQLTRAVGVDAQVIVQPNYCDCGLYLLHLAERFISDPERHTRWILSSKGAANKSAKGKAAKDNKRSTDERDTEWDHASVKVMRNVWIERIDAMSTEWKAYKAAKEKEEGPKDDKKVESSDDEVDIIEQTGPLTNSKKGGRKSQARDERLSKANRLR